MFSMNVLMHRTKKVFEVSFAFGEGGTGSASSQQLEAVSLAECRVLTAECFLVVANQVSNRGKRQFNRGKRQFNRGKSDFNGGKR